MGKDCDSKKFYLVKTEGAESTDQHLETSAEGAQPWATWAHWGATYQGDGSIYEHEYEEEEPEPQRRRRKGPNKSNKSLQSHPDATEIPGEKRKRRRRPGSGANRIIGGIAASNYKQGETAQEFGQGGGQGGHAFPWAVRVLNTLPGCESPTGGRGPGMCGGALISKRLVASAFHCVQNSHKETMATVNLVLYSHL